MYQVYMALKTEKWMWGEVQSRRNIFSLHLTHKELHNSKWRQPFPAYRQISPTNGTIKRMKKDELKVFSYGTLLAVTAKNLRRMHTKKRFISSPYYFHAIQILTGIESVTIYRTDEKTSLLDVCALKLSLVPISRVPSHPNFLPLPGSQL